MYIITALSILTIQTHPTEPTLTVNNLRMLVYDHMDQVWAIYSVLSIVVGPMFPLVNSSHLYISPISPAHPYSNPYISWQRAASAAICWLFWSSHIGLSNKPLSPNKPIQEGLQLIFTVLFLFHAHNVHNYCAFNFNHPNSSYRANLDRK